MIWTEGRARPAPQPKNEINFDSDDDLPGLDDSISKTTETPKKSSDSPTPPPRQKGTRGSKPEVNMDIFGDEDGLAGTVNIPMLPLFWVCMYLSVSICLPACLSLCLSVSLPAFPALPALSALPACLVPLLWDGFEMPLTKSCVQTECPPGALPRYPVWTWPYVPFMKFFLYRVSACLGN